MSAPTISTKLNGHTHSVFLFFYGLVLPLLFLGHGASSAQTDPDTSTVLSDTLDQEEWSAATLYEIEMLRLERWLRQNENKIAHPALPTEVLRLKSEAENFAAVGDYEIATIWLETIWELLTSEDVEAQVEGGADAVSLDAADTAPTEKQFRWTRRITTGVDFWRHQFNFNLVQSDSTFLDGSGNPSTAARLNFEYGNDYRNSLQGYTYLKYSRDYLVGEADVRWSQPLAERSFWRLENRIEGNSFFEEYGNLKYLQNRTSLTLRLQDAHRFTFDLDEEFMLRSYDSESTIYSNFFDNDIRVQGKVSPAVGTLLGLGFRNNLRRHPTFDLKDYTENRLDASWLQSVGPLNFSLENFLRYRDYTNAPEDTTFQDYLENSLYGEVVLAFNRSVGLDIEATFIRRNYDGDELTSLPDYTFWETEPEIYVELGSDWKISGGFYYGTQIHERLSSDASADRAASAFSILFEDYYRFGPTVTVEVFRTDGFILSVKESYLLERYPNSQTNDLADFNLFSDRNINSILLFMTWTIDTRWQVNLIANMDDDRGQKDDTSDSQSTIVGLEIGYAF